MRILIATDAWLPQVNGVVQTLGQLIRHLEQEGHEIRLIHPGLFRTIPCPTYPEIRLALWPFGKVRKVLDEFKPQAIHIVSEGPIGLAMRLLAHARKMPFTTAYHTQFPEYVKARSGIPVQITASLLRWFHRPSRAVMVPTQSVINLLKSRGMDNCVLWQRGVDLRIFNPEQSVAGRHLSHSPLYLAEDDPLQLQVLRQLQHSNIQRPVFLYAGRVAVEKNLEAFLKLDLPGEKWIAGDGPAKRNLEANYPQARWFGMLNHAALAELYKQADVFVFPSLTDTFGLVLLEAMASGCPVAAFPVNGPLDVVGVSGAGVLDWNLEKAALQALKIERSIAVNHARQFTWANCAGQFFSHLAPIEEKPATPVKPLQMQKTGSSQAAR